SCDRHRSDSLDMPLQCQSRSSSPGSPATPRQFFKVRRSFLKTFENQPLTNLHTKTQSRELWRETGREREFRALTRSAQCGGVVANAHPRWYFSALKVGRRNLREEGLAEREELGSNILQSSR